MEIRKTTLEDLPRLEEVFAAARQYMRKTGNPNQWTDDYPSTEQLLADLASGESYVCVENSRIVGTFLLKSGADPTYEHIYEGSWPNDKTYLTIHRIASSGESRGIFAAAMDFALGLNTTIRIDTHRDNRVMQKLLSEAGFCYCGIIHCWNGDERLAYQLN